MQGATANPAQRQLTEILESRMNSNSLEEMVSSRRQWRSLDMCANNFNDEEGLFARFKQEQTSKMRTISQRTTESHSTYADHSHGFRLRCASIAAVRHVI